MCVCVCFFSLGTEKAQAEAQPVAQARNSELVGGHGRRVHVLPVDTDQSSMCGDRWNNGTDVFLCRSTGDHAETTAKGVS